LQNIYQHYLSSIYQLYVSAICNVKNGDYYNSIIQDNIFFTLQFLIRKRDYNIYKISQNYEDEIIILM